jgi:hypothetical protein
VAGPLTGRGKIVVNYQSSFDSQRKVLTISKDNPAVPRSPLRRIITVRVGAYRGKITSTTENTWEMYCRSLYEKATVQTGPSLRTARCLAVDQKPSLSCSLNFLRLRPIRPTAST